MSTPSADVTAQYIAAYQEVRTTNTLTLVVTALLLYDVLLTSGREYLYIWRSPKAWVSRVLYVWNRYLFLLYLLLGLGTIPSISDTSCASLIWLTTVLGILNLIGPAMFTTLRIYALSKKNRVLGGVALVLSIAPFVINASGAYQTSPINLPAPRNCDSNSTTSESVNIGLTVAARGSLILADSLAIAVTWRQTRTAIQLRTGTLKRPTLEQMMLEHGTVYFCTLVSINVVDMVLVILTIAIPPDEQASLLFIFVDPITSILNSRFLLALHETNARMEGAGETSISALSLDAGGGNGPRAGSPELPEFLGVIGGPIHSFHHDDNGSESLVFAPPSQEEHESEPEGEILEVSRDHDEGNLV